jgi:hypothetical protein
MGLLRTYRECRGRPGVTSLPGVAPLTPDQVRTRERVEKVIRIAAPALNLVLAVGERVSKIVEPQDHEYYPPRASTRAAPPSPPK